MSIQLRSQHRLHPAFIHIYCMILVWAEFTFCHTSKTQPHSQVVMKSKMRKMFLIQYNTKKKNVSFLCVCLLVLYIILVVFFAFSTPLHRLPNRVSLFILTLYLCGCSVPVYMFLSMQTEQKNFFLSERKII